MGCRLAFGERDIRESSLLKDTTQRAGRDMSVLDSGVALWWRELSDFFGVGWKELVCLFYLGSR
jgi:hypothetical protein